MRRGVLILAVVGTAVIVAPAHAAPPPNDNFANAIELPTTPDFQQLPFSTVDATREPGEPNHAGEPGGRSIWFRLTVPELSTWEIHTCPNPDSLRTVLAVYTGTSVSALVPVASNKNYCGGSLVRVELSPGTYFIAVDDVAVAGGSSMLTWVRTRRTPRNTAPPTITGDAVEGNTLVANPGTWATEAGPISYEYTWERCGGSICHIVGEAPTLTLTTREHEQTIRVQVRASNRDGPRSVISHEVGPVRVRRPANRGRPHIAGRPNIGSLLEVDFEGLWDGSLIDFTFRWQRCRRACADIRGARGQQYRIRRADLGKVIRVIVTATNAAGSAPAASNATRPIAPRLCVVPRLRGMTLEGARRALERSGCRLGTPRRVASSTPSGRVRGQAVKPGKTLKPGARVGVVVSLGRKR